MSNKTIGRIRREQIERWNQLTALEIPDRGDTSEEPGFPSGQKNGRV